MLQQNFLLYVLEDFFSGCIQVRKLFENRMEEFSPSPKKSSDCVDNFYAKRQLCFSRKNQQVLVGFFQIFKFCVGLCGMFVQLVIQTDPKFIFRYQQYRQFYYEKF
eukprot:TRINITY_DN3401_c0_g1_i7.p5 TRINITY_DN3401_c0_g1~~TRINITY_DN3401_c0_g1_i7.p5  ORF type:complete len:106 (-),score=6.33 TRINITY_DN3401_c0_g1_i7:508-825(-)